MHFNLFRVHFCFAFTIYLCKFAPEMGIGLRLPLSADISETLSLTV